MKKSSILLCAMFLLTLTTLADGYNTLCFKGKMGGKISVIIAFDYHDFDEATGPYIVDGEWTNPKTGKSFANDSR